MQTVSHNSTPDIRLLRSTVNIPCGNGHPIFSKSTIRHFIKNRVFLKRNEAPELLTRCQSLWKYPNPSLKDQSKRLSVPNTLPKVKWTESFKTLFSNFRALMISRKMTIFTTHHAPRHNNYFALSPTERKIAMRLTTSKQHVAHHALITGS